jgi:xanthine dehydrogenase accessory factor
MVIAIVGSGGKTTLLKTLAQTYRSQGKTVFVTTTTHMFIEEDTLLTDDADHIIQTLQEKGYAMAGIAEKNKIKMLSEETYRKVCSYADIVLVEADGSKHMPLKYPASHEPNIPDNADEIIVVAGLHGLHQPASSVCHRLELVKGCLHIEDHTIIKPEHIVKLIKEGYIIPLTNRYPQKKVTVHLHSDGLVEQTAIMHWILSQL